MDERIVVLIKKQIKLERKIKNNKNDQKALIQVIAIRKKIKKNLQKNKKRKFQKMEGRHK